jgi:hypothetical protein
MMRIIKLIAVLLSDGSVDLKRYTVSFTEDKDVVMRLIEEFNEIGNIKLNWKVDKHVNSYRARVNSKKLVNLLTEFTPSFRMRAFNTHPRNPEKLEDSQFPPTKIPDECFSGENARQFLKYYATCDGGPEFSVYKRNDRDIIQLHMGIKIGCNNPKIKNQIHGIFRILDLNPIEKDTGFIIKNLTEIRRFHETIGFLEESKVRRGKLFKGFAKNDVVKMMILCGLLREKSNWFNKNFKSIEESNNFLIECIKRINNKQELNSFVEGRLNISL